MGGAGDSPSEATNKKVDDLDDLANLSAVDEAGKKNAAGETPDSSHAQESNITEAGSAVSAMTWLAETFTPAGKLIKAAKIAEAHFKKAALDMAPLMLDTIQVPAANTEKSYSFVVNLDKEVERKLSNVPDATIKDFYKSMRNAQMDHQAVGLQEYARLKDAGQMNEANAYKEKWAQMNAWLAFPENDAECEEGRKATYEYITRTFNRDNAKPEGAERIKDNKLLAKIYSLQLNDHDYLHNEDELTCRGPEAVHHLPKDVQKMAEDHMFAILESNPQNPTYKSPLSAEQRGTLAFYSQVLRQVLPQYLLDDDHKAERDALLLQYKSMYASGARGKSLAAAGQTVWQTGFNIAKAKYPDMKDLHSGLQLTHAEQIYAYLNLKDIRQLEIEQHEMRSLFGSNINSELAYPDQERLYEFEKIKTPMREYREGQVLEGRRKILTVFKGEASKYVGATPQAELRLKQWEAKAAATPLPDGKYKGGDWRLVYWDDPDRINTTAAKAEREAHLRFPHSSQCKFSNEGADLLKKWKGPTGLFGNQTNRLVELMAKLCDPVTKEPCVHEKEERKKGGQL